MTKETTLTEQESLKIITEMINKTKNSYVENGVGPLFWGVLVAFCSLMRYAEIQFHFVLPFDIWLLTTIALFPWIFYAWRSRKQRRFRSHDEIIMNYVWSTYAVGLFVLSYYASIVPEPASLTASSFSLYLFMYGVPTFITGGVKKFRPMIIGGIICWICSITSLHTALKTDLLLSAVSATAAWLIPGIILRRRYLRLTHV